MCRYHHSFIIYYNNFFLRGRLCGHFIVTVCNIGSYNISTNLQIIHTLSKNILITAESKTVSFKNNLLSAYVYLYLIIIMTS